MTSPVRGEIWLVNFDPTIGDEIQKTRPAAVLSIAGAFRYQLHLVVPITSWQPKFASDFWMVRIITNATNSLDKDSAANAFQIKSVSEQRFVRTLGTLTSKEIERIAAAVAIYIGYPPP